MDFIIIIIIIINIFFKKKRERKNEKRGQLTPYPFFPFDGYLDRSKTLLLLHHVVRQSCEHPSTTTTKNPPLKYIYI